MFPCCFSCKKLVIILIDPAFRFASHLFGGDGCLCIYSAWVDWASFIIGLIFVIKLKKFQLWFLCFLPQSLLISPSNGQIYADEIVLPFLTDNWSFVHLSNHFFMLQYFSLDIVLLGLIDLLDLRADLTMKFSCHIFQFYKCIIFSISLLSLPSVH